MKEREEQRGKVKQSLFPVSLFGIYIGVLFLMSGIHTGLIVFMNSAGWNKAVMTVVPMCYWGMVAMGLTLFTRWKVKRTYEEPLYKMAEATRKVANGDFSVYVPTFHTMEKRDYLDVMIIDFNKMVEELGSIETLKTDFFSNVSHEIKTPLAIIQNNAELLCMEKTPEKQKEYAEVIFQTTKRLSELISNILKLNKLEKQAITPVAEEYDLCGQLAECAVNYEPVWEKKDIGFDADMEDSIKITADAALMEVVWNNLFSNAVKFTEPGGTIKLTEQSDDSEIRVSVEDNGCGMTEEQLKKLDNPFFTTRKTRKVGLGIPFLKMLAEMTGGEVKIESVSEKVSENHGTTTFAKFGRHHIDFIPLGDMTSTVTTLIQGSPEVDFTFTHKTEEGEVRLSCREIREVLGSDVSLSEPEVLMWIDGYLREQYAELK